MVRNIVEDVKFTCIIMDCFVHAVSLLSLLLGHFKKSGGWLERFI
jgi:hypothetical protein